MTISILKICNLVILFFWISYALDAWLPSKTRTENVRWLMKQEYPGRGGGSGNFYFYTKTQNYSFNSVTELKLGDEVDVNISPVYQIVRSFCTNSIACFENRDSPYSQPLYTSLIVVLVLFILYTLIFEKELRFLRRLTLGNAIATFIFASIFILMWVIL
jgi:hypothetical protein